MTAELKFRTSTKCSYDNSDPRCVEVATNVPGKVVVRNSTTLKSVEFTTDEWTAFVGGVRLGEFDVKA